MKGNKTNHGNPFLVRIKFENIVKPIEIKVKNIKEMATLLGLNYYTLQKIIYKDGYKQKCSKFTDLFNHIELIKLDNKQKHLLCNSNVIDMC